MPPIDHKSKNEQRGAKEFIAAVSRGKSTSSWNQADLQRLKDLLAGGASPARVASALNRSQLSVKKQARKLGTAFLGMLEAKERRKAKLKPAE